ncbi:scoloptoxin SSD552-like [Chrysoperla carnea]|uniref:scoloptoxin SSD552-like n=1 Tax=Chrysoperla carnea TaxID=189513 RepID=UPI001D07440B|nr:scoloptoxin SSD552-like [Chrysoperla carnea]
MAKHTIVLLATIYLFAMTYSQDSDSPVYQYACDLCDEDDNCVQDDQCTPSDNACPQYQDLAITDEQKQSIVDKHNELRQKVASGGEDRLPSAANMKELVWDDELANIAQCYANKCVFQHMRCELSDGRGRFGQNIYEGFEYGKPDENSMSEDYPNFVQNWYDEEPKFDPNNIDEYKFDPHSGHFSQVIWAKTESVGCGSAVWRNDTINFWLVTFFCNYSPGGNVIGASVYEQGDSASNCENGASDDYSALCQ